MNRQFTEDSRPSKKEWIRWIDNGVVVGQIIDGTPYVDEERFISTTNHSAANDENLEETDLLG